MTMQRRALCILGMITCCMPALVGRPDMRVLASAGDPAPEGVLAPTIPAEYLAAVLDAGCQRMFDGDSRLSASGPNRYRGNAFSITLESQLREFSMELRLSQDTELHFSVFRALTPPVGEPRDPFCPVYIGPPIPASPAGPPGTPEKAFYASALPTRCGGVSSGDACIVDADCTAPDTCKVVPITLEAGYDYALAVAWGTEDVTYYKQPADAPPFPKLLDREDGKILGSVARNGLTLPLDPDPLACLSLTPFRSTVYSMEICLESQPGACCLGSVCQELKPEDCLATPGNVFTRERLSCADLMDPDIENLDCPLPVVACCIPGTGCVPLDKFTCAANQGTTIPGSSCSDVPNPCTPKGACCQDRGVCDTVIEAECDVLGGVYRGDDTTCATIDPSCSFGACCLDASCLELTLGDCGTAVGAWQGHGTLCADDGSTCDPRGACCDGVGGCQDGRDDMTGAICTANGGSYRGDWSTCGTLDVPCGTGACCTPAFGCIPNLNQSVCEGGGLLGSYMGDETSCDDVATACMGTCCFMTSSCLPNESAGDCALLPSGAFAGYDTSCPAACTAPRTSEACCLPNGSCIEVSSDVTPSVCAALTGISNGPGSSCASATCPGPAPKGACCLPNGLCAELAEADCAADSGVYDGDGTTCTLGSCGVCCQADGSCNGTVDVAACAAGDGLFFPGVDCTSAPCPPVGACCVAGQPCDDLIIGHACGRKGGFFVGEGETCGPVDPCIPAACCHDDGTCTMATPSQCAAAFGTTDPGVDCGQGLCPPAVACCHDDGSCTMVTEAACTASGGTPDSTPDSFCGVDDTCPVAGGCCTPDENCADITEQACTAASGVWNPSMVCTSSTDSRCTLGSCCRMDGSCVEVVAFGCSGIGDDFAPGACSGRTCVPTGACCTNGDCADAVSQQDCQPDGCYEGDGTFCDISGLCSTGASGFSILDAVPPSGSMDARIPHAIDDAATLFGWDSIEFSVDVNANEICKTSFQIIEVGGDGTPPDILEVTAPSLDKIRLTLSEPIEASSWIKISHVNSTDVYCLGAQPGDVGKSGTTDISDVGELIACLNPPTHCGGVKTGTACTSDGDCTAPDTCDPVPCDPVQCDIDRGGLCTGADLPMLINLLNGAGEFVSWDGQTLVSSPCS